MSYRVTLHFDGRTYKPAGGNPKPGQDSVRFNVGCPHCKTPSPIDVRGKGIRSHDHDTYYADAEHIGCGGSLGQMRVKVDTIFGIEEDERVLNGRCRVY
jgi:hypothetical protein